MAYLQEISTTNRGLWIFLLQQSASMKQTVAGSGLKNMDVLADNVNRWLQNMVIRCMGGDGFRDYMDVAIIGYRTQADGKALVQSPLLGA